MLIATDGSTCNLQGSKCQWPTLQRSDPCDLKDGPIRPFDIRTRHVGFMGNQGEERLSRCLPRRAVQHVCEFLGSAANE